MPELVIRTRLNGPLVLEAPAIILDHLGNRFTPPGNKDKIALCRCGNSRTKPFCDGTHREIGFQASETAGATGQAQEAP